MSAAAPKMIQDLGYRGPKEGMRHILDLLARLYKRKESGLDTITDGKYLTAIAAPATLAHILLSAGPVWPKKLNLLVVGAEIIDRPDQGSWYSLTPLIIEEVFLDLGFPKDDLAKYCGLPKVIDVTFVGPNFSDLKLGSPDTKILQNLTIQQFSTDLDGFMQESDGKTFDLAVMFQPGFDHHDEWFSSNALHKLVSSVAGRTFISSYAKEEQMDDIRQIKRYGLDAKPEGKNPFGFPVPPALGFLETTWGGYITEITSKKNKKRR